jgi:aminoglycoside/choline kinase family phosphotransferase
MERLQALRHWLGREMQSDDFELAPASSDASFRRYFRVSSNGRHYIVMDAPPAHEDCRPFVQVARLFGEAGVHVPEVLAQDLENGFLLLTDLGDTTYLAVLDEANAQQLYLDANAALVRIQLASRRGVLPAYDRTLLMREMNLFPDWYINKHLGLTPGPAQQEKLNQAFETILANCLAQPQVYVHRDYHSRNLMLADPNPGVLDFQDAVYGPITYDLASLYKDAYIQWEEERVLDWAIRYWEAARAARLPVHADFYEFYRDFEWMGAQRHIKVLGIFARLFHRDGKAGYLKDLPLVMDYLRKTCERYTPLNPLARLLDELENRTAQVGYTF